MASVDLVPYIKGVVSIVAEDKGMFVPSKHISIRDQQHLDITHVYRWTRNNASTVDRMPYTKLTHISLEPWVLTTYLPLDA